MHVAEAAVTVQLYSTLSSRGLLLFLLVLDAVVAVVPVVGGGALESSLCFLFLSVSFLGRITAYKYLISVLGMPGIV